MNSWNLLPTVWVSRLIQLDSLLLAMAMAALGLRTHVGTIRRVGVPPLMLAFALFVSLFVFIRLQSRASSGRLCG